MLDYLYQKTQNSEQNFVPFVYTKGLKFLRKFMSFGINRGASHIDGYFEFFNNAQRAAQFDFSVMYKITHFLNCAQRAYEHPDFQTKLDASR